jgi:hypothetical protein
MKLTLFCAVMFGALVSTAHGATAPEPAKGGRLPSGVNSDQQSWTNLIKVATPVAPSQLEFETWASDPDIYTNTPKWPSLAESLNKKLRPGLLQQTKMGHPTITIDGPCAKVGDAVAGNFPVAGSTPPPSPLTLSNLQPCYAEEVRRNRPSFDYIVGNKLNTQPGLAQAFQKAKTSAWKVSLPTDAVEVKADWLPLETLVDWLHANNVKASVDQVKKQYLTRVSGGVTYGLVSLHLSSKEIPNWVWASFEHQQNPGRCDTMGCYDSFGARKPAVAPVATANGQYGACVKTPAVHKLFKDAKLDDVWSNYCLKSSQIDVVSKKGTSLMLGDSFTERIAASVPINQSSCMSCHAAAAVTSTGAAYTVLLNNSPMGKVTLPPDAVAVDFIWGILAAPVK